MFRTKKKLISIISLVGVVMLLGMGLVSAMAQEDDEAAEKLKRNQERVATVQAQIEEDPKNTDLWMELGKYYGWMEDSLDRIMKDTPRHMKKISQAADSRVPEMPF